MLRGTLTLIVALGLSPTAFAQPPVAEGSEPTWNARMFGTGAVLLVGGYVPAALEARNDKSVLYVPVVGPWLLLFGLPDCPASDAFCEHDNVSRVFLVADGILQLAGVGLMAGSLTARRERQRDRDRLRLRPSATHAGGPSVVLSGRF